MEPALNKYVAKLMAKSPLIQSMAVRSVEGWEEFLELFDPSFAEGLKLILEEEEHTNMEIEHQTSRKQKKLDSKLKLKLESILHEYKQKS